MLGIKLLTREYFDDTIACVVENNDIPFQLPADLDRSFEPTRFSTAVLR